MENKKQKSVNNTMLNISASLVSPNANSTRIGNSGSTLVTGIKRKPTSPLSSRTAMSKTSLGTICYNRSLDAKTYTDITSQGLTSRLVRYGGSVDDDSVLNKSSPLRKAFIKTSPFPVIKFKKQLNKASPQRSISLSSVRIPPPAKVTFQPNSRLNILRSGSMISMHNLGGNANNSNDNEPLNPSTSEPEAPTRSVLDALKEISRKRINNEELDAERIKKQCKDVTEVDNPSQYQYTISDINMSDLLYRSAKIVKRQRETSTQISPQSAENEKQKKRFCTKNNEVLSSLSSSISLTTPKRDIEIARRGLDLDKAPPEETPAPSVPTPQMTQNIRTGVIKEVPQSNLVVQVPVVRKEIVPVAPKLTLFNKKYDENLQVSKENSSENEENMKKMRFVKPKDSDEELENQIKRSKNVEKSKLAILLQCLAGELDEDEPEDVVDSKKTEEKVAEPVKEALKVAPIIEIPHPEKSVVTSVEKSNTKKEEEPIQKPEKPAVSFNLPQKTTQSVPELIQPSPIKPLLSFGTPGATTTSSSSSTSTNITTTSSNISVIVSSSPTIVTPAKTEAAPNVSFLFGNVSNTQNLPKPLISAPTSAFTALEQKTSFNFGTNTVSEVAKTVTTQSQTSKVETPPTFVFGGSGAVSSSASTIPTLGSQIVSSTPATNVSFSTTTAASVPTINIFGGFDAKVSSPATVFKIPSGPSVVPSPNATQTQASNVQSSLFTSSITSATSPSSIFGTAPAVTSLSGTPSNLFSFGGQNQGQSQLESQIQGQTQNQGQITKKPETTTSVSIFGTTTTTSSFTFGGGSNTPIQSSTGFGSNAPVVSQNSSTFGQGIFGQTSAAQAPGGFTFKSPTSPTQPSAGGFSFNPNETKPVEKGSVFSRLGPTSPNTTTTSVVSPSKSLFTFTSPNQSNNQPQTTTTTAPTFGANFTNMSNISQTSSIFGGNTTLNSTSQNTTIFGSNTNNNTTSGNLFGGNQPIKPQATVATPGLDNIFKPNSSNFQSSVFGSNSGQKDTTFNFGANNNNNSASTPFTFGQSNAQSSSSSSQDKPFTFGAANTTAPPAYGSSQQTPEPPKFNFTASAPSPFGSNNSVFGSGGSTAGSTGSFNFTGNQGTTPEMQGGLSFNIGTGGGQQNQGRRPIRMATRRLNK